MLKDEIHKDGLFRIAKSYLRRAEAKLKDVKDALSEENYPYALRLSQECVELSLKASLRALGIEYPKVNDVSDILIEDKSSGILNQYNAYQDPCRNLGIPKTHSQF